MRVVILGAGVAGVRAAETLRTSGFDGEVALLDKEVDLPFDRPPLSKEFLQNKKNEEEVWLKPPSWYSEQAIDLRLGFDMAGIDHKARVVRSRTGDTLSYDKLLVATGVKVRRLNTAGTTCSGVFYLRSLRDARAIKKWVSPGQHAVIIGAGFIGLEVAASFVRTGMSATIVEPRPVPLERVAGERVGRLIQGFMQDHGVTIYTGQGVSEIQGPDRVSGVVTTRGQRLPADVVVVGIGVDPWIDGIREAPVKVDNGIWVDEYCRTSIPDIFACGDVAQWPSAIAGRRIRVEHWDHAWNHGVAAAKNMMGQRQPFDEVPYFWSDLFDSRVQYVGHAGDWDEEIDRGGVKDHNGLVFYLGQGRLQAVMGFNRPRDMVMARRLLAQSGPVDREQLADDNVPLKNLFTPHGQREGGARKG